jgi:queuine tRNA-ribosyltransferase
VPGGNRAGHHTMGLNFTVVAKDESTRARTGILHTAHGDVETPIFMPVGTAGTVKAMTHDQLEEMEAQIILANTYHLCMRPGHEKVREFGGLHRFMSWPHPILTDSGGFQVMSLKGLNKVTEDGVWFSSHLDGSRHFFSPEGVMEFQLSLGSDIIMPLDECVDYPASHETLKRSVRLTSRWAERSRKFFAENASRLRGPDFEEAGKSNPCPSLFGIVQGGTDRELRRESALEIGETGFDGYAIGGLSVGEPKDDLYGVTDYVAGFLPEDKPRYLMGVGTPEDLVRCVALGIDMFDCVMPTRNARNGSVFTSAGKLSIKSARYANDTGPLDPECGCRVCRRYSRAYIRHLSAVGEMSASVLATFHNLRFYLDMMKRVRQSIKFGGFGKFLSEFLANSWQESQSGLAKS